MTYFNKKEEVIEVILTSYGKYKLSRGQWSPKYYAFFDEDVIYDSRYTGAPEISGTTEARIQEQTPSMRAQTSYTDLPRQIKKMARAVKAATPRGNNLGVGAQAVYANSLMAGATRAPYILPLGNSSIDSERQLYAPAWEIKALKNEFTASMSYISSSYENITKIPQLKVDIDYTTNIHKSTDAADTLGWNEPLSQIGETEWTDYNDAPGYLPYSFTPKDMALTTHFSDGSMIVVEDDYLVLEVNELNSAKAIDQFFLEVWEVEEDEKLQPRDRTGQSLTRMSFVKYPEEIVNDILLDPSELPEVDPSLIDDTYVEYFMDVLADEEIDDSTVCNYIATDDKTKLAWSTVLACYDALDTPGSVLYTSEDIDLITALCEEGCE
jgi:hypothetical protein